MRDGSARVARWSSHRMFVVAAVGATVGLGNAWRFPQLVAEHGGAAFVAVYLLLLLLLGWPLLLAEMVLARRVAGGLPRRFPREVRAAQAAPAWRHLPWLVLAAAWAVLACLVVSGAWLLAYLGAALQGAFADTTARSVALRFDALAGAPAVGVAWLSLFLGGAVAVCANGVRRGLERAAQVGLALVALGWGVALVAVAVDGDATTGLARLAVFDPGAVGGAGLRAALLQAFYTLTLGVGVMHAYAVHLPRGGSLPGLALRVVAGDTLFALLAASLVLTLLGAAGLAPTTGPRLVFESLPLAFGRLAGGGPWLAVPVYLGLVAVAWMTALALLEPLVLALAGVRRRGRRLGRVRAALLVGASAWLAGTLLLFLFAASRGGRWVGQGVYGWLEYLGGHLLVPAAALLLALFVGWQLPAQGARAAMPLVSEPLYRGWRSLLRYAVPPLLALLLLAATGILPVPP